MYGLGIIKGLGVTFKHFINTYVDDIRRAGQKLLGQQQQFERRQGLDATGIYTVEYPNEKVAVPERFRFTPFLVVEDADHPERPGHDWCTSCGICSKVCPPQCIWIVRGSDPKTGRPIPEPEAFFIDIDICMNCGFCAEFCPFDAIKMDHDYEMASYDRTGIHIHDKPRLSKPFSYWRSIAPTTAYEEALARGGWEHTDQIKEFKKTGRTPTPVTSPDDVLARATPDQAAADQSAARKEAVGKAAGASEDLKALIQQKRMEALARFKARRGG